MRYWEIWYVSCEGNTRWSVVACVEDWDAGQVSGRFLSSGSMGDDPAEITSCEETCEQDTSYVYYD